VAAVNENRKAKRIHGAKRGAHAKGRGVSRALAASEARLEALRRRRAVEHEALLRAARRVFVRRGYAQTRVEDVLDEAGISTRAFYRFHASKDELFLELFSRANAAALQRLRAAIGACSSASAQLDAYIEETLDLAYEPRRRAETMLFSSVPSELAERYASEVLACREGLVAVLREILLAGRNSGLFASVEPDDDAWSIHGALGAAMSRLLGGAEVPVRGALAERLKRFCRAAVGCRATRDRGRASRFKRTLA
jgi:AcrR family transcriptional regulator